VWRILWKVPKPLRHLDFRAFECQENCDFQVTKSVEREKTYYTLFRGLRRLLITPENFYVQKNNFCGKLWRYGEKYAEKPYILC
jgi:hypothetical protein